ncbi:MAG: ABC transporter permease subunit [Eubacteriaceae bacterium]|jgi:NitT/TauT family transport system permease protein|nr:ABC transporter permease subunit [Eubacteriaceae bacterium]
MKIKNMLIAHVFLFILLSILLLIPKQRPMVKDSGAMLVAIVLIETIFLIAVASNKTADKGAYDIVTFIWIFFIIWELTTSVYNIGHPVLAPSPENVFKVFQVQWQKLLLNVVYSLRLLFSGLFLGLTSAIFLGLFAGWITRLKNFTQPIANVMAPIPAVVFSPYLVSVMPSFRSASMLVIFLGVFWPTFLTTINRIAFIEPQILDTARSFNLSHSIMIRKILLPYILPGVVSGSKITLTTSLLMLNFAELMGATHGMGYYVQNSITYANYTHAVAGIIVIGIVVTVLNIWVTKIQKHAIGWR